MTDAPDLKEFFATLKRNAAARTGGHHPACDRPSYDRDEREGTPEQGWSDDIGDAVGLGISLGVTRVVRKMNRVRHYRDDRNYYTEYAVRSSESGVAAELLGCYFIVDPYPRDIASERQRVAVYWAKVAAGDVILPERPECAWCTYGVPVKQDRDHPMFYSTVVCANRDVISELSPKERKEAYMRCNPRVNFNPSGVHAFAAGYLGWEPDPACIARLELLARPPKKAVVVDKPTVHESDALALQRHHGFWEDDQPVPTGDRLPEPQGKAIAPGGGMKSPRRRARS